MTNILVVDNDPKIRKLLRYLLKNEGYDISKAINGKAACEAVSKGNPDLVLLDVEMPVMSGFEVLDVLRKKPDASQLPVVMITSRSAVDCEQLALYYGVAHYISKPWKADMVHSAVRTVLRNVNVPIPTPPPIVKPADSEGS